MVRLDNSGRRRSRQRGRALELVVFMEILAIGLVGASCRKGAPEGPSIAENRSAAASIADADALYAQRTDLMKVRQALIALRQALAANPANFDIAWRAAK